jgi:hypothetical protein
VTGGHVTPNDWISFDQALAEHMERARIALDEWRRSEPCRQLAKSIMQPVWRDGQKRSAAKKHENHTECSRWLREKFADKRNDDPTYSVEQFRNWLKTTRKFTNKLWHKGKLISSQRLGVILGQADPPKNF